MSRLSVISPMLSEIEGAAFSNDRGPFGHNTIIGLFGSQALIHHCLNK
jgi:hypothetical protein